MNTTALKNSILLGAPFVLVLVFAILGFHRANLHKDNQKTPEVAYYSDYFVFVAIDEPLVVPIDFNWSPSEKGYNREFKSWYGSKKNWPIAYFKDQEKGKTIPKETWEHENGKNFTFDKIERTIGIHIQGAPKMTVVIPEKSKWVAMPSQQNKKEIYAFQTTLTTKGRTLRGWMVYERIRWDADFLKNFGNFKAFYWVPLVIDGDFYHFEQHSGYGKQTATKWYVENDKVNVVSAPSFSLNILEEEVDRKSGRKDIAKAIQIKSPDWNLDITLESKGAQVGHGEKFPKGLAYYRQSILLPKENTKTKGYGMLELILEND